MNSIDLNHRRSRENGSLVPFAFNYKLSRWIPIFIGITALLTSINALALETPHMGKLDKRCAPHQLPTRSSGEAGRPLWICN